MDSGWVDEGFGAVADTFAENFDLFPELGAAVTVYVGGRKVVELWDGRPLPDDSGTARRWYPCSLVPKGW